MENVISNNLELLLKRHWTYHLHISIFLKEIGMPPSILQEMRMHTSTLFSDGARDEDAHLHALFSDAGMPTSTLLKEIRMLAFTNLQEMGVTIPNIGSDHPPQLNLLKVSEDAHHHFLKQMRMSTSILYLVKRDGDAYLSLLE